MRGSVIVEGICMMMDGAQGKEEERLRRAPQASLGMGVWAGSSTDLRCRDGGGVGGGVVSRV